jgi:hypothetical protein
LIPEYLSASATNWCRTTRGERSAVRAAARPVQAGRRILAKARLEAPGTLAALLGALAFGLRRRSFAKAG